VSSNSAHGEVYSIQHYGGRAVLHSEKHTSTGSTVDTFLTQDDLMSQMSDFSPNLSDVDEGSD
jgi:hypothetical protein